MTGKPQGSGTPATGAGATTSGDTPRGGRRAARDDTTWETWWEMNRFEFLAAARVRETVTGDDDSTAPARDAGPDALERARATLRGLRSAGDPSMRRAALVSLARIAAPGTERDELRDGLVAALQRAPTDAAAWETVGGLEAVADDGTLPFLRRGAGNDAWPCALRVSMALSMPSVASDDARELVSGMLASLVDAEERGCDAHVSMGALVALGEIGAPEVGASLAKRLADRATATELRALAVTALVRQEGIAAVEELGNALTDADPQVRRAAALALGVVEWRTAADRAADGLRQQAARRGSLPSDAETSMIATLERVARAQREARAPIVRGALRRLVVALGSDQDPFVQRCAAVSLGRIARQVDAPQAIRALEKDLAARRPFQREFDLLALALARAPSCLEAAVAALREPDAAPTTRGAAAVALGLLADPRARPVLRAALASDPHPTIRGYVALALGMTGDREARGTLRDLVAHDRSPRAVGYAALGLALVGTSADAATIVARLGTTADAVVALHLVHALRLVGGRRAVDALVEVARDPAAAGRLWAVVALGRVTEPRDVLPRRLALIRGFNYLLPSGPLLTYVFAP